MKENHPRSEHLILAAAHVNGFAAACAKRGDLATFATLQAYYKLADEAVAAANGRFVKPVGDGVLLTFARHRATEAVASLRTFRNRANELWRIFDSTCQVQLRVDVARVLRGPLGPAGAERFDVVGAAVNNFFQGTWSDFTLSPTVEALLEIRYRRATCADAHAMHASHDGEPEPGSADERMAEYLDGKHHPNKALEPRAGFVATQGDRIVGYIAGHLTQRFDCEGEVQYLRVAPPYRRVGVATRLLQLLAEWFSDEGARLVCVNCADDHHVGRAFYKHVGADPLRPDWLVWSDIKIKAADLT